jgi:hypothetical protein
MVIFPLRMPKKSHGQLIDEKELVGNGVVLMYDRVNHNITTRGDE